MLAGGGRGAWNFTRNEQGFSHLPFQSGTIKQAREYAESVRGAYDTVCLIGIGCTSRIHQR
jgi:hypothetical protein